MNILVTGAQGQLGRSLQRLVPQLRGTTFQFASHAELDITRGGAVRRWLDAQPVDSLINAAANTAVDRAAVQGDSAMAVNAQAPGLLAQACAERHIRLLHLSTDYVFDGRLGRAYLEDDAASPLNAYGRSKLAGEQAVLAANPDAIILRTSWVFSAWGNNFVRTMLALARQQASLRVVCDQVSGPTWAGHLAQVLCTLALQPAGEVPGGIYHFSGMPWVSWYEFAQEIFAQAQATGLITQKPLVQPIAARDWPSATVRPANSRLDNSKLEALLGTMAHDWREGLRQVLADPEFRQQTRTQ